MSNKDIYLDIGSRRKDVWIGVNREKKELTFSLSKSGGSGYARGMVDTTENWEQKPTFIPDKGLLVIYMDHGTIIREGETINVPGIKVGDGQAYLVDLPFVGDDWVAILEDHIRNTVVHITQEERNFWNDKLNCEYQDDETLLLNRE